MPPLGGCWGVNVWNGVAAGMAGGPGGGGGPPLPLNFCTNIHEIGLGLERKIYMYVHIRPEREENDQ